MNDVKTIYDAINKRYSNGSGDGSGYSDGNNSISIYVWPNNQRRFGTYEESGTRAEMAEYYGISEQELQNIADGVYDGIRVNGRIYWTTPWKSYPDGDQNESSPLKSVEFECGKNDLIFLIYGDAWSHFTD